ncbi:MAG: fused MFS/spermidine synthase [Flavobacterium sp.]|nr:fused MFS/spermidine synthase [Flavobacterium sp.]
MLDRILSFFYPINIHKQRSQLSKSLEVTWNNGQLVLDSQNTNYSFGSLQRILKRGLSFIGFDRVKEMQHILVLGVAGGSVIKTLSEEIGYSGKITGVEIDPEVIEISKKYFNLDRIPNLDLVLDDAFEFSLKTREKYDLIIIDIFQDTTMPNFLFEEFFVNRICFLLKKGGFVLFNTMILAEEHNARNKKYLGIPNPTQFKTVAIKRVQQHNELIVIEKLS